MVVLNTLEIFLSKVFVKIFDKNISKVYFCRKFLSKFLYLIADPNSFQTCLKLVVASNYTEPCVVFQILPAYIYKKYNNEI